ncbi:MAG: hypothetical protein LJF30_22040 [Acidobacteria bacterium]|jgi:hypothetical protein|nr:hypothetical protein [Acidobacteriota bacterium]
MLSSLRDGFRSLGRNWGLVVLVLVVNLALALLLAAPLALQLERDLSRTGASGTMMYGFDYDWWTEWSERQEGPSSTFAPDVFGPGLAFKNLDLLLRGEVPLGIFPRGGDGESERPDGMAAPSVAPLVLGIGALYLLVQVFLTGGLLGAFRAPQGGWTFRGLVHGSGFYFGRLLRVSLLALGLAGIVFALNVPFARWVDALAREAVSERTALALGLGRHALLLLALLLVHMVASFARVLVVQEERQSAALALLSSAGFCARNLVAALGQYGVVLVGGVLLLASWAAFDARFEVSGWKSQLVMFAVFQAFLFGRIALRLGLLASQLELRRARAGTVETPEEP